jgi:protein-S-isoprenylcysteine O-methyltransferase Ste14
MDDDRRIVNNPFARAVVKPDDEKATSPVLYVAVGLLSLVLAALFVAALVLPPMFMHTLIIRGIRGGRPGMIVVGGLLFVIYAMMLWGAGKRIMGRPAPSSSDDR